MTKRFISYAQNAEDVILWRALHDIEAGFYIDVGAFDPELDSVTKALYDLGWSGVNIEPAPDCHQKLVEQRPRDICLNVAISNCAGILTYYQTPGAGLSTLDGALAARYQESGMTVVSQGIPVLTLTDVCRTLVNRTIHFLKIDTEGFELATLQGLDLRSYRPWIILIESISPDTKVASYEPWEKVVLDQDYDFVYFDGVNRYYLAKEQAERRVHFAAPPNCLDNYVRSYEVSLEAGLASVRSEWSLLQERVVTLRHEVETLGHELDQAQRSLAEAEAQDQMQNARLSDLTNQVLQCRQENEGLRRQIRDIYTSTSWVLTRPIRVVGRSVGRIVRSGPAQMVRKALRRLLRSADLPDAPDPNPVPTDGSAVSDPDPAPAKGFGALLRRELSLRRLRATVDVDPVKAP